MRIRHIVVCFVFAGCANDPIYLTSPNNMEAGMDDGTGNGTLVVAKSSLVLPIKPETTADMTARMNLANKLGVMVPYVKVGDIDIEVEYTIKNLDGMDGIAKVDLNGANEWFQYDPSMINLDPTNNEAPPTPPLSGDIPVTVPANGSVDGVFREDQLLEASIDMDQITRANINPFRATLTIDKNDTSFQPLSPPMLMNPTCQINPQDPTCAQQPVGSPIPRAAFAEMIEVDLVFKPDHHMVLDYTVRVRDHRGIVHDMGLAAPMNQIVQFAPAVYIP